MKELGFSRVTHLFVLVSIYQGKLFWVPTF